MHLYSKLPAVGKVCENVAPCAMGPLSKSGPVTVCGTLSLFVHVTEPPALMVTSAGLNAKLAIVTGVPAAAGAEV